MTNIWLSVLIPTFNGESFLPLALDSILRQNDSGIECIVVDDGSTDTTLSIIDTYKNKLPIRFFQRERNGNWVANTNFALSLATGKYVCFLHQDDIWLNNRLEVMRRIINQFPESGLYIHATEFIDHKGRYLGVGRCPLKPVPATNLPMVVTRKLLIQNFIPILAPIFRRDIAMEVGCLDETLWYTADWDLWLKISSCTETIYYPYPLSGYRVQQASQTFVRSSYLDEFRNQHKKVVDNNLNLWDAPDSMKARVYKLADFSIQVNTVLAAIYHGKKIDILGLLYAFISLGPSGWFNYFQVSRIWERAFARLRAWLLNRF